MTRPKARKPIAIMADIWATKASKRQPKLGESWARGYGCGVYDGYRAGYKSALRAKGCKK